MADPDVQPHGVSDDAALRALQRALGEGYALGEPLGSGGFARVLAARDVRLDRSVAVKVLRPELASDPEILERFKREARALAGVRHPNVIDIYAVGEGEGVAYFVMPLVEGPSLRELLDREGKLEVPEIRRILVEACRGLAAAHDAGVVHRDVKPANVLLDGPERRVILTDFGIAKAMESDEPGLTTVGSVVGTFRYMSPEQAAGEALDSRSDLYSLGVVAYEMVAGRAPFEDRAAHALILDHIATEPPRLRSFRPDCPEELALTIHRCLAKGPEERWEDAAALARALESGVSVEAGVKPRSPRDGATEGGVDPALRRLRVRAPLVVMAALAILAVDVLVLKTGALGGAALLVAVAVVATLYGRAWTAGYGWRELWGLSPGGRSSGRSPGTDPRVAPTADDEEVFGEYATGVRQARGSRVVIVRAFRSMTRSEQERFPGLLPAADTLYQTVKRAARQSRVLETRVEEEASEVLRGEVEDSRRRALTGLEQAEAALSRLRDLTLLVAEGAAGRAPELRAAIEEGRGAAPRQEGAG